MGTEAGYGIGVIAPVACSWGHHVDAHMRTLLVVNGDNCHYSRDDIGEADKPHAFQQFVLP